MWRQVAAGDIFPRSRLYGSLRFLGRREAAYPNEGLRRLVGEFLRFERLEDSPVPLVVVATRFDDGAEEWFSEGPALEAVLASAALPAVYPAIERAGSGYIDGGVVNNVPLSVAFAARARRIYVLLCGGVTPEPPDYGRPYEAMLVAFGLSMNARLRRDLASVPSGVDVIVLEQRGIEGIVWQDFSHTDELLDKGYRDACADLDRVEQQLAERDRRDPAPKRWSRARVRSLFGAKRLDS
jgi:NTE family protein